MPSLQMSGLFRGLLTKLSIVTSIPLCLLLLGLQAMIDVKFSCPCKCHYNGGISSLILFAPAIAALAIMLFLLRPFKYNCESEWKKHCCCGKNKNNSGSTQRQETRGTSQGQDNSGTPPEEDKKKTSQSEISDLEENLSCEKTFIACLTPSIVWMCLWFIDGDYLACGATYWDGHYTCDKERHPNCWNWCKPNELSQVKAEAAFERTREWIRVSKTIGYSLAIFFSLIAIVYVCLDCCKNGKSTQCRKTDPESQSHERQGPGTENQQ